MRERRVPLVDDAHAALGAAAPQLVHRIGARDAHRDRREVDAFGERVVDRVGPADDRDDLVVVEERQRRREPVRGAVGVEQPFRLARRARPGRARRGCARTPTTARRARDDARGRGGTPRRGSRARTRTPASASAASPASASSATVRRVTARNRSAGVTSPHIGDSGRREHAICDEATGRSCRPAPRRRRPRARPERRRLCGSASSRLPWTRKRPAASACCALVSPRASCDRGLEIGRERHVGVRCRARRTTRIAVRGEHQVIRALRPGGVGDDLLDARTVPRRERAARAGRPRRARQPRVAQELGHGRRLASVPTEAAAAPPR